MLVKNLIADIADAPRMAHRRWMAGNKADDMERRCQVCYENTCRVKNGTRDSWNNYFSQTNTEMKGYEICDCYRVGCCEERELTESRFLRVNKTALSFVSQVK
jgi:hypothetical protein